MKKSILISVVIALAAIIWLASGLVVPNGKALEDSPQTILEKQALNVRVRTVQTETITRNVTVTGRTQPNRSVRLTAEIAGAVEEILVSKGDQVEAGDALIRLEMQDREARVAEARKILEQRRIEHRAASELTQKGFTSQVRLAQAQAELETARANLKRAENDLEKLTIAAPFAGVVDDKHTEIGAYLAPGDPVFTVIEIDPLKITAYVTERDVALIAPGSPVTARITNGRDVTGNIIFVAADSDPDTRTFRIEARLDNEDHSLRGGMTARLEIPAQSKQAVKISPAILTLDDTGTVGVKVVDDENRVVFVPITILGDGPGHMWIGNVEEGSRLIVVGQDFVIPGQIVEPVEESRD